jgi:hypothetical protein
LRHELFETPATTFPTNNRPVHCDELLQYAKNISQHTVPPTYRERAPQTAAEKDKETEDAASSGVPTNGVNTPANAAIPPVSDEPKEAEANDGAPADLTAEEEEWLKKLKDSKIAWYPWPSDDKIRTGNLYKLMYYQAKGRDMDNFDIYAYEEAERIKSLPEDERPEVALQAEEPVQEPQMQQPVVPRPAPKPAPPVKTFDMFDDMEDI